MDMPFSVLDGENWWVNLFRKIFKTNLVNPERELIIQNVHLQKTIVFQLNLDLKSVSSKISNLYNLTNVDFSLTYLILKFDDGAFMWLLAYSEFPLNIPLFACFIFGHSTQGYGDEM